MLSRRGTHSRREFLQAGAVAMTGAEFGFGRAAASGMFQSGGRSNSRWHRSRRSFSIPSAPSSTGEHP